MRRPGWATAAAIYSWIAGGFGILFGISIVALSAFVTDTISLAAGLFGGSNIGLVGMPGILLGIAVLIISVLQIMSGIGLWRMRRWGWIMAVATFIVLALLQLVAVIMLIANGLAGIGIIQTFFMGVNILFAVGLLLRSTAVAYAPGAAQRAASPGGGMRLEANARLDFGGQSGVHEAQLAVGGAGPTIGPSAAIPPTQAAVRSSAPSGTAPRLGVAKTEVANAEPAVMAWLVERSGPRVGREHRLKQQVTLGRDPARCEIVLDDSKISGEHARIRLENGQFVLYDLASTNHTYVNGQEIQKQPLRDGDQIRIGPNTELSFMHIGK